MGEYRECRGTVGGLYLTIGSEYSLESEMAKQSRRMNNYANME